MKYIIHEDFLDADMFKEFQKLIFSTDFGWCRQEHQYLNDRGFWSHLLYTNHVPSSSFYEPFIVPILGLLGCNMLSEVRANCLIKGEDNYSSEFHTDRDYKCKTAILYMNTNNGVTLLGEKERKRVKSIENNMLVFDSQTKHCAISQTDVERRIVVNFNYI